METRVGQMSVTYSARGIPTYTLELWHDGLKKHRVIKDGRQDVIRRKAELQIAEWSERWKAFDMRQREISEKNSEKRRLNERKMLANERSLEAQKELERLSTLLASSLTVNNVVDWENLKDRSTFSEHWPAPPTASPAPQMPDLPREPLAVDPVYLPRLGILDKLINSRKRKRITEKRVLFEFDHDQWRQRVNVVEEAYSIALKRYQSEVARLAQVHTANGW